MQYKLHILHKSLPFGHLQKIIN